MHTALHRWLPLFPILFLVACSSSPIKLYPGPKKPDTDVATVKIPVELEIISLNGEEVEGTHTLLGTADQQIKLLPGQYELVIYYKNIWPDGTDAHTTIKSDPITLDLSLAAGHIYQVGFKHAKSTREAKTFRKHFSAWVTDLANGKRHYSHDSGLKLSGGFFNQITGKVSTVKVSKPSTATNSGGKGQDNQFITPLPSGKAPGTTPARETTTNEDVPAAALSGDTNTAAPASHQPEAPPATNYLNLLKAQWGQASQKEKRAFLQWISEHP